MADRQGMFGVDERAQRRAYVAGIQRIPRAMQRLEVPIIAAVNGAAIGAGLDLAMMCDLRVASDRAKFAESFVSIGLIPGDGGTWFLPRAIGWERAADDVHRRTDRRRDGAGVGSGQPRRAARHPDGRGRTTGRADRQNPGEALRMAKRLLQESQAGHWNRCWAWPPRCSHLPIAIPSMPTASPSGGLSRGNRYRINRSYGCTGSFCRDV